VPDTVPTDRDFVHVLSLLTLGRQAPRSGAAPLAFVAALGTTQRQALLETAELHHVVIRALTCLQQDAALAGEHAISAWAEAAAAGEQQRIDSAIPMLDCVCQALAEAGCPTTVIKTLDHWPDLGDDLDLYTTGDERAVTRAMTGKFKAKVEPRSWGDRLARKWNFAIPGLRESIEVHCQRLGQTGEHTKMAHRFVSRRTFRTVQGHSFPVPAPEERVIVATLQRMYRHFYFRLSDIVNTAAMLDGGVIDFAELRQAADLGGIWPGVATYLRLVADYAGRYRATPIPLPAEVRQAAMFGGEHLYVKDCFLRVPIMPFGARLYTRQVTRTALRGDVPATFRLSLLPPLASVAAVAYKLTGSDKGIW
jgi:hypothetical protein